MNKLPLSKRTQILHMLVEGSSMRSISRIVGVSINTVTKLLVDAGNACEQYHDEHVRGLTSKRIQCDEIWSFCYAKARNLPKAKSAPDGAGSVWTWTALDADSKLIVSWLVGGRDAIYAKEFMLDVADRLTSRVQLTTDGHLPYLEAVEGAFGVDIDYAQLVKLYGSSKNKPKRVDCIGVKTEKLVGKPDEDHINTAYVERQNFTMRMHMRRYARMTNAFSKKIDNHCYALALYFMYYNFVKIHSSLKCTPAMASGVTDKLWEMEDIVNLIRI